MFRDAYKVAMGFTQPVILFWKTVEGECGAGIGACVVINSEGWIVTAAHIVKQANDLLAADRNVRQWELQRNSIRADTNLTSKERNRRLEALGTIKKKSAIRATAAWGINNSKLVDVQMVPEVDLAIGRLDPFDPAWVKNYPKFKDPAQNFDPGSSLCKLGYPFHDIKPTYDDAANTFSVPPEMSTLTFFPIEGMFTRTLEVPSQTSPFRLAYVETSSPGLRGQSGGPTFDPTGAVWAIQSQTRHLPLGFSPEIKDGNARHKEHQFLNVGMGTHAESVLGLLNQLGIKYEVSNY